MRPILYALASLALASTVFAAAPTTPAQSAVVDAKLPAALNEPIKVGFQMVKHFPARSGLTGWVWKDPEGQYGVFYTTADGESLIAGALLSSSGENWSQRYSEEHIPKPDLGALWEKFEKANYIASGELKNPSKVIYAILDPNCIFCHYLWLALEPYREAGLQVRWVPVGFLHEDSAAKAAAILQGGEPFLRELQDAFEQGGKPGIEVNADLKAKLDANLALMREANIRGTPGILYQDATGRVLLRDGMPKLAELAAITGLPMPTEIDPRLARFN